MKKQIRELIQIVDGYKTYITSVTVAVYTLLQSFEVIVTTPEQDVAVYGLLAAIFGVSVRAAIKKVEK